VDFDWSPELLRLRAEAEEVADKAVAEYGVHDDAWINGYSREFSRELGRRGWRVQLFDLAPLPTPAASSTDIPSWRCLRWRVTTNSA